MEMGARTLWSPTAPFIAAIAAAACLSLATSAAAQLDTRSNGPIDITADQLAVTQSKCVAVWKGSAEAIQDDARLRADTITVYSRPKGVGDNGQAACGGTDRVVAEGNVYYVTPQQHVRGDKAVYATAADEIVITGDVIVVQGNNVARGDRLTIKVSTKEATMDSNVIGAGKTGRVRGVFYPDQNGQAPGQPRAAAKP
jgi:lipopolysaccharide export system protein LptA